MRRPSVPHSGVERSDIECGAGVEQGAEELVATTWQHFEALPRSIADPMDGLIVATALALELRSSAGTADERKPVSRDG